MTDEERYRKAKERVEAKMGFFVHLAVYVAVNIVLYYINSTTSSGYRWHIWPLMGWGIGVLFHGAGVFIFSGRFKEKMIEKEMRKE